MDYTNVTRELLDDGDAISVLMESVEAASMLRARGIHFDRVLRIHGSVYAFGIDPVSGKAAYTSVDSDCIYVGPDTITVAIEYVTYFDHS